MPERAPAVDRPRRALPAAPARADAPRPPVDGFDG